MPNRLIIRLLIATHIIRLKTIKTQKLNKTNVVNVEISVRFDSFRFDLIVNLEKFAFSHISKSRPISNCDDTHIRKKPRRIHTKLDTNPAI